MDLTKIYHPQGIAEVVWRKQKTHSIPIIKGCSHTAKDRRMDPDT